ncbi:hypothetical protein CQ040_15730 [Microbacterium sp. MYb54]|nr:MULTISPECIES: hypothetical protein [unclassified Microbacterium]PQZ53487.1 hypothetical protein CQ032_15080 [Microbacterium sp. MYb43]PQZ75090.1 hypothetical protein CQ031_14435 [Microbacterium sp. MYb40]PRB63696.1 hypothetical protein CQ021_15840 [Microbacterium sp. MYb24]PRB66124.1 hypothetical protein CQ027_19600 [Microbacterium sp. MYb32]PRB19384.1 hypothetical protein CQ040_15730 [Microbacterium sp. MYb54]
MIVAYFAAHQAGGEHRQNSATTWVNSSHNVGASLGSALAGIIIIQAISVPAAIIGIVAGAAALLIASAVWGRGRATERR